MMMSLYGLVWLVAILMELNFLFGRPALGLRVEPMTGDDDWDCLSKQNGFYNLLIADFLSKIINMCPKIF